MTINIRTAALVMTLLLSACGGDLADGNSADPDAVDTIDDGNVPAGATWQWQLTGTLNSGYAVDFYDIDLMDTEMAVIADLQASGHKVICYFSAGSWEDWRDDADEFDEAVLGEPLDGWEGERWLDVRAESLRGIMTARLDIAVNKGCDAVEPDNVDGYSNNSGFSLTSADQLSYNRFLAASAHDRGLLIALKNDLDQVEDLVSTFDFAVNEECFEYDECDLLVPFIEAGKAVLHVEYSDSLKNDVSAREAFCAQMNTLGFSSLVLPLNLDDSFRFSCL